MIYDYIVLGAGISGLTVLKKLKENVSDYLKKEPAFSKDISEYTGKLVYIKSALPFPKKKIDIVRCWSEKQTILFHST